MTINITVTGVNSKRLATLVESLAVDSIMCESEHGPERTADVATYTVCVQPINLQEAYRVLSLAAGPSIEDALAAAMERTQGAREHRPDVNVELHDTWDTGAEPAEHELSQLHAKRDSAADTTILPRVLDEPAAEHPTVQPEKPSELQRGSVFTFDARHWHPARGAADDAIGHSLAGTYVEIPLEGEEALAWMREQFGLKQGDDALSRGFSRGVSLRSNPWAADELKQDRVPIDPWPRWLDGVGWNWT